MRKTFFCFLLSVLCFLCISILELNFYQGHAYAQNDWKQAYADTCRETQNAMSLSADELTDKINRCDKLLDRIHELDGPNGTERKVYTKRLKMCRELYLFALQYKEKKE